MWSWSALEWQQCLGSLVMLALLAGVIRWDRKVEKRQERERKAAESQAQSGAPYEYLPFDESEEHNGA